MIDNNQVPAEDSQLNKGPSQYPQGIGQYPQGSFQNQPSLPNQLNQSQTNTQMANQIPLNPLNPINPNIPQPNLEDQELYTVMKQVVELKQGTHLRDVYNRPEIQKKAQESSEQQQKEGEAKPLITNVQKEFKNLFNKDMLQNNSYRKRVLYLLIAVIILNLMIWQSLCMLMNVCYGEGIVMIEWYSQTIFPLIILLTICYIVLYFSSDLLYKPGIQIMNILIILLLLLFIGFGIYGIIAVVTSSEEESIDTWFQLTQATREFYTNYSGLYKIYKENMYITSILYLIIGVLGIILLIFSYQFYYIITVSLFDWRPPLRSRLHEDRAGRMIELYAMFNEDFRRLHEAENRKQIRQIATNVDLGDYPMNQLPASSMNQINNRRNEELNDELLKKHDSIQPLQQLKELPQPRQQIQELPMIQNQLITQGENNNQIELPRPNQTLNESQIPQSINPNPSSSNLPARRRLPPVKKTIIE